MGNQSYRFIAIVSLIAMSMSTFVALLHENTWCVTGYDQEGITYFSELNGFMADEPNLFVYIAILGLVFAILLSFVKSRSSFLILNALLLLISIIPMSMFATAPFYQVMYDSIGLCDNYWLCIALLCFCYFQIFALFYLLRSHK